MSLKSSFAATAGRSAYWFLHTFMKGGSSLPGKITNRIDPDILATLGRDYEVVIITGTNGKTLTTALTVKVLHAKYSDILTNPTGSNMKQGIITAFLTHKRGRSGKQIAVLEVDEANVIEVTKYIKPTAFVFTNIFRDQMDRYGELYTTYQKILDGVANAPEATVIANGDAPIFHSRKLPNPFIYYGFDNQPDGELKAEYNTDGVLCPVCNHILHYKSLVYSNLGKYYCPNCGFARPELQHRVTELTEQAPVSSSFVIDGQPIKLNIGGTYNIYNALAAYSVGRYFGIEPTAIAQALDADEKVFGRQEVIQVGDKAVTLILVKNPVGLNQVFDLILLNKKPFSLVTLLNANYADGIDTSWIWDGNFEKMATQAIPSFIAGGERVTDIAFRWQVAGVPEDKLQQIKDLSEVAEKIKTLPTEQVYVLATYTAVLQLREKFAAQGFIAAANRKH
ncbi:Mur ligase family protein [Loigolactobacillus coryniformis]|uniref:Lipid II isoglutaminyl synthase (glutamine-hydrolyzing) subunit MurT n=1 Tax=Loigolactobacillus coryniformis subsp. torquens DSM 20004 = KCTC 3535 TaxID=1423822 RepID=A0A2D1KMV2_9LACO|nr:Mur ligase family protein [Loigolactobacillus coryniformis]ATO43487.1 UDP-N-acetylmuramyl peptide synthase [Loigolactobacillus coryniformis subsp. torquens DSM 20004 = KCTC 3535]KRK80354.1 UDP-N-acetylmuramyl tripeptide synthase [Loigolactobacillus coryniformis subsp. torquens DSM 20004 = KCTC 3535]